MILDSYKLCGKVAVVTGANTGIGQGIAVGLAEAGADIVGVGRSDMSDTAAQVSAAGRRFVSVTANLVSTEPIPRIIGEALAAFGHINILVNNAGIIRRCDALDFNEQDWDDVLNTNLKVLFFLAQAAAKQFVAQGTPGKIINIASMLSYQGGIRVPSYAASKGGVKTLTMALCNEWAKYGINVNAIAPGYIATNNTAALRADPARSASILERIPAGRWGTPADMAGAAVFLAAPASDYMNGFTLAVDGGWLAR